jgi:hypothetical protein
MNVTVTMLRMSRAVTSLQPPVPRRSHFLNTVGSIELLNAVNNSIRNKRIMLNTSAESRSAVTRVVHDAMGKSYRLITHIGQSVSLPQKKIYAA